jgi:hypothetical protein
MMQVGDLRIKKGYRIDGRIPLKDIANGRPRPGCIGYTRNTSDPAWSGPLIFLKPVILEQKRVELVERFEIVNHRLQGFRATDVTEKGPHLSATVLDDKSTSAFLDESVTTLAQAEHPLPVFEGPALNQGQLFLCFLRVRQ